MSAILISSRVRRAQQPQTGSLRWLSQGAGLGPSHGLWCCRVPVGAALGVLFVARRALAIGCLLVLALGIQSWGRREEKVLVRQHHQVQCRTVQDTAWSCVSVTTFTPLLGGIWQCHSETSCLLALKRRNMVKSNVEVVHDLFNASVWF